MTKTSKSKKTTAGRPVLVCTEYRGVFFGYTKDNAFATTIRLERARMAIVWGTTRGVMQLAETGATSSSKMSARADVTLHKVTSVFDVTEAAAKSLEAAP